MGGRKGVDKSGGRSAGGKARPADATRNLAQSWRLDGGVGFLLRLMDARYGALYQDLTRQTAITPRQFGVLLALFQKSPLTLTELAAIIRADRSTLGEMIARMATRKLVVKTDNGADRRSQEVAIAPDGEAALLGLVDDARRLQDAFLSPLPKEERAHFLRSLRLVAFGEE